MMEGASIRACLSKLTLAGQLYHIVEARDSLERRWFPHRRCDILEESLVSHFR